MPLEGRIILVSSGTLDIWADVNFERRRNEDQHKGNYVTCGRASHTPMRLPCIDIRKLNTAKNSVKLSFERQ